MFIKNKPLFCVLLLATDMASSRWKYAVEYLESK